MNISGKFNVRDLWEHKDLGTLNMELALDVTPHETKMFRFVLSGSSEVKVSRV